MSISLFTRKPKIYGLTARGKKRAEEVASQTPEGEILCMLEEHGESTPREIANSTRIDLKIVNFKLKKMSRVGLVSSQTEEGVG